MITIHSIWFNFTANFFISLYPKCFHEFFQKFPTFQKIKKKIKNLQKFPNFRKCPKFTKIPKNACMITIVYGSILPPTSLYLYIQNFQVFTNFSKFFQPFKKSKKNSKFFENVQNFQKISKYPKNACTPFLPIYLCSDSLMNKESLFYSRCDLYLLLLLWRPLSSCGL
jgi:hypothetical protein